VPTQPCAGCSCCRSPCCRSRPGNTGRICLTSEACAGSESLPKPG